MCPAARERGGCRPASDPAWPGITRSTSTSNPLRTGWPTLAPRRRLGQSDGALARSPAGAAVGIPQALNDVRPLRHHDPEVQTGSRERSAQRSRKSAPAATSLRRRPSRSSASPPTRPEVVEMRWGSSRAGRRSQDPLQHLQHLQHPRRALAEEPAFRGSFRSRRCLIPASGFSGLKTETGRKQPYYLTAADDDGGLAFAGLWDEWCGPEERLLSCTIVVGRPTRSSPRSTIGWSSSQRRLMPPDSIREPAWIPCGP